MSFHAYIDEMAKTLMTFQFTEELLKMYISTADAAIHTKLEGILHYEPRPRQLWKKSLGQLIEMFDRVTEDKAFVRRQRSLAGERNFFAHRGYLFSPDGDVRDTEVEELLPRLTSAHAEAIECMVEMMKLDSNLRGERLDETLLTELRNLKPGGGSE